MDWDWLTGFVMDVFFAFLGGGPILFSLAIQDIEISNIPHLDPWDNDQDCGAFLGTVFQHEKTQ